MKKLDLWLIPIPLMLLMFFGIYKYSVASATIPLSKHASYQKQFCEIHHTALQNDVVRVVYGLVEVEPLEFYKSQKSLFPNANRDVLGGCVVERYKWAEVRFCKQCRNAEKEYDRHR